MSRTVSLVLLLGGNVTLGCLTLKGRLYTRKSRDSGENDRNQKEESDGKRKNKARGQQLVAGEDASCRGCECSSRGVVGSGSEGVRLARREGRVPSRIDSKVVRERLCKRQESGREGGIWLGYRKSVICTLTSPGRTTHHAQPQPSSCRHLRSHPTAASPCIQRVSPFRSRYRQPARENE